mmetsp:Transcript_8817/g.16511  ORF Transcript_8817/g.16511 Transcript_8817/m.16511 type:complete len:106 (+) Transcript_8817:76-393(+)
MSRATIREVIFSPAQFFNQNTTVAGLIVLLDLNLGRMDISSEGAKLIVEIGHVECVEGLLVGCRVQVTGRVKKQQRRTFLEALCIVEENSDVEESTTGDPSASVS